MLSSLLSSYVVYADMSLLIATYNDANLVVEKSFLADQVNEICRAVSDMPLFLQGSKQKGHEGELVFDPKAANSHLKEALNWKPIPIPFVFTERYGRELDGGSDGVVVEIQFGHYAYLGNNLSRSHALFRHCMPVGKKPFEVFVMVVRSSSLPAANCVLHFDQAKSYFNDQINVLKTCRLPVILMAQEPVLVDPVSAVVSSYPQGRCRDPVKRQSQVVRLLPVKQGTACEIREVES